MAKTELNKIIVVKVGSSLVTNNGNGIDVIRLKSWAEQIAQLKKLHYQVVLVSSGSIAEGLQQLNWSKRPKKIRELQAAAAIGQMGLVQIYQQVFREFNLLTAQILLTHEDVKNRTRYLNARATLQTLLNLDVVPIVNENDSVATKEIKLGDNDTLGALVTNLIDADLYCILTDQDGLYDSDPRKNKEACLIGEISVNHPDLEKMAGGVGSLIGTGGMLTKVKAAKRAALSGAITVIASGKESDVLLKIIQNKSIGTRLLPLVSAVSAKEQWIINQLIPAGEVIVDEGAVRVLKTKGKSLLPVGCVAIEGAFHRGEVVSVKDQQGSEIARGLINYGSEDANRIIGHTSVEIEKLLGYVAEDELIHRDNMVVLS